MIYDFVRMIVYGGFIMIKAVIFDMDGLLIDSEMISYKCYRDFLKSYGFEFTLKEYIKDYSGKQLITSLNYIKDHYQLNYDIEKAIDIFHEYEAKYIEEDGVELKPGAKELLKYLKEHHYKTIIATSSREKRAQSLLEKHQVMQYMDDIVYGFEVEHGKPAPDIFLKACEKLDVLPNEALVLEDSEAGIDSAYQAHIPVICIPDLIHHSKDILDLTVGCYDSLDQLIDVIVKKDDKA